MSQLWSRSCVWEAKFLVYCNCLKATKNNNLTFYKWNCEIIRPSTLCVMDYSPGALYPWVSKTGTGVGCYFNIIHVIKHEFRNLHWSVNMKISNFACTLFPLWHNCQAHISSPWGRRIGHDWVINTYFLIFCDSPKHDEHPGICILELFTNIKYDLRKRIIVAVLLSICSMSTVLWVQQKKLVGSK